MAVSTIDALSNGTSEKLTTSATGITVTGTAVMAGLALGANNANSPQILFENSDGVTGDAALSTYDDASGTMLVMGSNFYINSSGSESRFNTSEESSAVMLNRNGDLNLLTGGTGATATTRLKISSSGNVGIGNSIPDSFYAGGNNLVVGSGSGSEGITIYGGAESNLFFGDGTALADNLKGRIEYSHGIDAMSFYANNAYAMRIDGSKNLLVGKTSGGNEVQGTVLYNNGQIYATASGHQVMLLTRKTNNGEIILFYRDGTNVGNIYVTGSSTSYNTSSDYRLKENVVDLTGASARVNQLNPSRFNFITDADTTVDGFLAHEVADVVPEAITGTKDAMRDEEYEVTPAVEATYDEDGNELTAAVEAVMGTRSVPDYQGIDQSKLVPLLTAALQEALTEIASLKTRVEALEA